MASLSSLPKKKSLSQGSRSECREDVKFVSEATFTLRTFTRKVLLHEGGGRNMRFSQFASPGVDPWHHWAREEVTKDSVGFPFYSGVWAQESPYFSTLLVWNSLSNKKLVVGCKIMKSCSSREESLSSECWGERVPYTPGITVWSGLSISPNQE